MNINIGLVDFLIVLSCAQGICFALIMMFSKYFRGKANVYLGLSLLIIALISLQIQLLKGTFYMSFPKMRLFEDIELALLLPAVLYLYYRAHLQPNRKLWWKDVYLFLLFIISLLANLYVGGHVYFGFYELHSTSWVRAFYQFEFWLTVLVNVLLLVVAWRAIKAQPNKQTENLAAHNWIRLFHRFHVGLIVIWLVIILIDKQLGEDLSTLLWVGVSLFYYWIGFVGLFKFRLADNRYQIQQINGNESKRPVQASAAKTSAVGDGQKKHFENMIDLLEHQKLYLDPGLSRDDVAERLGINSSYLSQIISEQSEKNFSEWLNYYRVQEVKRMIEDEQFDRFSMIAIGFESGFNSKSAFYTGFKREAGMTPTAYKNQYKASKVPK